MAPTAGYSGTPLVRKLGVHVGTTVVAIGAPPNYASLLGPLPLEARITTRAAKKPSFVHLFVTSRTRLSAELKKRRASLESDGVVWVSWPKKSSKVPTDVTEDVIREVGLPLGFVDVKVCALDDTWSGLKLVIRKSLRGKPS
ncbi:MAG: DUF3052 domain-containing protein [Gemmatimonadaceae bacterium]